MGFLYEKKLKKGISTGRLFGKKIPNFIIPPISNGFFFSKFPTFESTGVVEP